MKRSRSWLLSLFVAVATGLYLWLGSGGGQRVPGMGQLHLWVGSAIVAAIITGAAALAHARA